MRAKVFAGAALVAVGSLWLTPAFAAPVVASATLDGGYAYTDADGGHIDDWSVHGAGVLPLGASNFAVQGDLSYNDANVSHGGSENNTNGAASLFYAAPVGRVGASVGYDQLNISGGGNGHVTTYGAFGDWYASDEFTASLRGGGLSGSGSSSASYAGGQLVGYVMPNLAIAGTIDYFKVAGATDTGYGVSGEYLLSKELPFSVTLGYTYTTVRDTGVHGNANTYSIGLKYYFGGGDSLKDRQRSGVENWGASSPLKTLF